jgi:hypothetical protein
MRLDVAEVEIRTLIYVYFMQSLTKKKTIILCRHSVTAHANFAIARIGPGTFPSQLLQLASLRGPMLATPIPAFSLASVVLHRIQKDTIPLAWSAKRQPLLANPKPHLMGFDLACGSRTNGPTSTAKLQQLCLGEQIQSTSSSNVYIS